MFNDTATTQIYPLSLHDALPISAPSHVVSQPVHPIGWSAIVAPYRFRASARVLAPTELLLLDRGFIDRYAAEHPDFGLRSVEHTSELQSRQYLVCRLLLEKKQTT